MGLIRRTIQEECVHQEGQGLVEFMLLLPALLLLLIGIFEFGKLMVAYSSISTASRDAARFAVSVGADASGLPHYQDCQQIRDEVSKIALFVDPAVTIEIDQDGPGGVVPVEYCAGGVLVDPISVSLGSQIIVTVSANYQAITPIANLPTIPITAEARRTVLTGIYIDD